MRPAVLIAAALVSAHLTSLGAQIPLDALPPGATVRVTAPAAPIPACHGQATFTGLRGDTLLLAGDPPVPCLLRWVERLEARQGRRGNGWTGAILGVALGGAVGYVIGSVITSERWEPVLVGQR
jgi:hypothetical protein